MGGRVDRHLEEWQEDVLEHLLEGGEGAELGIQVEQARDLDEPPVVGRVELVVDDPRGELVPLVPAAAVDRDAVLGVLVLGLLEVVEELARDLGEVSPCQLVPGG